MTTVAGIIALCLSAMANRNLLRQVSDDLHKYTITPMSDTVAKSRYLLVLKEDAQRLDDYYREGEPLRLGFGLYPGERLRQPVLQAIRGYRPPEPKGEIVSGGAVQTVRLDSMALFDVGQSRLKIGSTKVLVEALVNIKAKPGWLILVAGYTDSTGDEKSNQQLSLRRAEAVRDWMLQTSDIPFTCFAVQGLGESQPAATNDTPEGRNQPACRNQSGSAFRRLSGRETANTAGVGGVSIQSTRRVILMAIPVYLWLKDDGGADIKGSVDVQGREGSIEVVAQEHNALHPNR
jgi:outer membrane protein OmpA-like peptidoglycan-associated protein